MRTCGQHLKISNTPAARHVRLRLTRLSCGPCPARRYFPTLLIVLLAVFNDGAMIALSKDRVTASRTPNRWDLPAIFVQGARLGCPQLALRRPHDCKLNCHAIGGSGFHRLPPDISSDYRLQAGNLPLFSPMHTCARTMHAPC